MKILITGKNGYIAKSIHSYLSTKYDITTVGREDFDLTNWDDTNNWFRDKYFDVIIHTAVLGGSRLKKETWAVADCNLAMYYNLLQHRCRYDKLIHFGSGAEFHLSDSPYGMSKRMIANSIQEHDNFFNIRIYGVFDENELDTRFIKANLLRYINHQPMMIQNKKMTFFYMKDLIKLVKFYIETSSSNLLKEATCSYVKSYSLLDIANFINKLDNYQVPIYIDTDIVSDYESSMNAPYGLDYCGLEFGIQETFIKLKV